LIATILGCRKFRADVIPVAVALYVVAGYWFTASTCFANPAVVIARSLTNTFSGNRPVDAPWFILAEIIGALISLVVFQWLLKRGSQQSASAARTLRRNLSNSRHRMTNSWHVRSPLWVKRRHSGATPT
jgi:hypothetical protein